MPRAGRARALGFNREAREDAVMQSILRVLEADRQRITHADPLNAVARKYAMRVVQNQLISNFRKEHLVLDHRYESLSSSNAFPEDQGPGSGSTKLLTVAQKLLAELSERDRALLEAYLAGSETFHEEHQRQAMLPGTARVRIHRLLKALQRRAQRMLAEDVQSVP
jgi:DNA-directed RNA polymerase specialized sigma24 family protein